MGRFSEPLSPLFADVVELKPGDHAVDVGCGPGALTAVLVDRLGPDHVSAADPSASFVEAARARLPGVVVELAPAESLPFADNVFDVALAQLVVHFMADPVAGLREMARVTRPGGVVASCVWDHAGDGGPLSLFWEAVHELDPLAGAERGLAGAREGQLAELSAQAGLDPVEAGSVRVTVPFRDLDDWWEPFTLGVGPAGAYVADLNEAGRDALRSECARRLPVGPFTVTAAAWTALGRVPT